jgi:phenylacetate-CoA ligase
MLFAWLKATGTPFHRPRVVMFTSDGMSDATRRLLAEEYNIPLLSRYGAVESCQVGFECEWHRGHHVNMDLYALRITDDVGRTLPVGENGHVVVSNLLNRGMVLLNFRLGDLAAFLPEACPCGRSLPLLSWICGRSQDLIELPSGRVLHPYALTQFFHGMEDVRQYQLVQKTPTQLDVKLVVPDSCDRERLRTHLALRFREALGDGMTADFHFVPSIVTPPGEKRRVVVTLRRQGKGDSCAPSDEQGHR